MIREETICAPATAMGKAGVCIIRISGEKSHEILDKIFRPVSGSQMKMRELVLGDVFSGDIFIDRALAVKFAAPNSYTGENVAEVQAHGGEMTARLIMQAAIDAGSSPAQPGEFSKRAFLNGKMDVSQAEAVQDLIGSLSAKSAEISAKNMRGDIFEEIKRLQNILKDVLAAMQAGIEYPEENLEDVIAEAQRPHIEAVAEAIEKLIKSYDSGKMIKEGVPVAIAGNTNVGKSSLLNVLLGEDRAIVTDIPGTTRDILAESFDLKGIPVIFYDTAGIRETSDAVEKIGVERAKKVFEDAAVILMLFDASRAVEEKEIALFKELAKEDAKVIAVLNKTDLENITDAETIKEKTGSEPVCISAYDKSGINILLDELYSAAVPDESLVEGVVITNARHKNVLKSALESIKDSLGALDMGVSLDCVTIDLSGAWEALGEITGETLTEDIIDRIFENFCLGK